MAGGALAPLIIVSIAIMVTLVEGVPMVAEQFLNRREERGRAQGRADERDRWIAWLKRKQAAEDAGTPFSEPPPEDD